jgi:hypothetical protein
MEQKHKVRHLLPTLYPISDPLDISPPPFGYNFKKNPRYHSELRSSIEDFIQPKDQVSPRSTGYSRGHIRSILELDTFGPQHSDRISESRSHNSLPLSPNLDRNKSRQQRVGPPDSKNNFADTGSSKATDFSKSFPGMVSI